MVKDIVNVVLTGLLVFILDCYICFAYEVGWQDIGRGILDAGAVLVDSNNAQSIYIGANNRVFKTSDGGLNWKDILSIGGRNRVINFLLFDPRDKNSVYVATGNGLFYSPNQGADWKKIFKGKNYLENGCTALAILPYGIYLGTEGGLFVSKDKGRSWHKQATTLGSTYISAIVYNLKEPDNIYAACADGVFKSEDSGQSWKRIFIVSSAGNDNETEEMSEDQEEAERFFSIRYISIDPNNADYLYLATSRGVYRSQDKGQNWELLSSFGLLNRDVRFLLVSGESHLYAVGKSGVFEYLYDCDRWQELSLGLIAEDIRFLAEDNQGNLYAACDTGIFKTEKSNLTSNKQEDIIALYTKDEPGIRDVQQAAIKYAEVRPEKIADWRRQARIRAILPKLTIGLDRSKRTNYEIYTSATTKYVYEGPHDKSDGWDVTLSWELGDLIWNEDQTSIDVRSKLMVQLRDDIVDEVTKLYFERIRVKMEIDNLSIEDRKKHYEKELRLRELTAQIDGLTGGYFSSQIQ